MYSSNSKDVEPSKREEGNTSYGKITKATSTSSSANPSSPWLRLKDPRIVRVSRAFGGKDRHSKVCTIRGLRDRRVRLSVPTAIQLYDLQDRLGLNQPSKVVDWLLNAAKQEIDELPPLPISPGRLGLNHQQFLHSHEVGASGPSIWSSAAADAILRAKSKEAAKESVTNEKENWITKESDQGKQVDINEGHGGEISSFNFLPKSSSNNNNNNPLPSYGSYYHLGPSNFPLPQLGSHGFISVPQTDQDHLHSFNVVPLPSTFSSQILVCPPNGTTQPLFPSHTEIDPRHINQFQMLNTNSSHNLFPNPTHLQSFSQSMRPPFHFMNSKLFPSHSISGTSQSDREQEFTFK